MNETEIPSRSVFDVIEGLTAVDPDLVKDFQQAMTNDVIPEIVKVVEERRLLAAQTRQLQLNTYHWPSVFLSRS